MVGRPRWPALEEVHHIAFTTRMQQTRSARYCLAPLIHFVQVPHSGNGASHSGAGLSTSFNIIKAILHRLVQRPISQVILDFAKLTVNTSNHTI